MLAAPRPLHSQCTCPPHEREEQAFTFGLERLSYREFDEGVLMFGLRSAGLNPNGIGHEFSFIATFAPYPFMFAEVGPILTLGDGPVSFLARFGIGALVIPPLPEGYAGLGMLVRMTDRLGMRVDVTRRFFQIEGGWDYFQSVGFGITTLKP